MPKIGVYICHCGENIAGAVNIEEVKKFAEKLPDVVVVKDYLFMCSDPGQEIIKEDIRKGIVDRVVVAACTPRTHEPIFRRACEDAGLNKYYFEMANIRDQCSWAHWHEKDKATEKAKQLIAAAVAKARLLEPLEDRYIELNRNVLVIGGGIAGIFAALDLANAGFKVYLVEKSPSIGGNMAKLDKTFPTNDCSACILTPLMVEVANHPNIELLTYSEVESVEGTVGNFKVKVRKKQTWVDWEKCTGCGACLDVCPPKARVPDEFNEGLSLRGAIYIPFPQAVPKKAVIDIEACVNCAGRKFGTEPKRKKTGEPILAPCEKVCPTGAADRTKPRDPNGEIVELNVGAIIVATGYRVMDKKHFKEYAPDSPNVITALQMERLISATGPTEGKLIVPADIPKYLEWKKKVKKGEKAELNVRKPHVITFISCVGSRDDRYHSYCSKVCCMYMLKQAMILKEKYPDLDIYIFFIDIRTPGKDFDEYYMRCRKLGIKIIKGKVGGVQRLPDERLLVKGYDADIGKPVELISDIVVLATAIEPNPDLIELARKLGINVGAEGFLRERHTKLYPVDTMTEGVFICGCAQGPKDIPESVAQAKAAAASVMSLLGPGKMKVEPLISEVNQEMCSGCGICVPLCPYGAIELAEYNGKVRAKINEAKCKGCGVCAAACPSKAISLHGFTYEQVLAQIRTLAKGEVS
ncbi:MAG TPA: CoB--CoM heterodisulfide reductase iron-sulfur subunit A family protein [Archaeoglobus profundus]|nr:CoB--CoM heterodisulfide reductase iron-sulfur subunit A family protein [Archaeoglobus profundus]